MDASIGWRKVNPSDLQYINNSSRLVPILQKAFESRLKNTFEFPITLMPSDISKLEGIAACGYEGANELITVLYNNKEGIIINLYI